MNGTTGRCSTCHTERRSNRRFLRRIQPRPRSRPRRRARTSYRRARATRGRARAAARNRPTGRARPAGVPAGDLVGGFTIRNHPPRTPPPYRPGSATLPPTRRSVRKLAPCAQRRRRARRSATTTRRLESTTLWACHRRAATCEPGAGTARPPRWAPGNAALHPEELQASADGNNCTRRLPAQPLLSAPSCAHSAPSSPRVRSRARPGPRSAPRGGSTTTRGRSKARATCAWSLPG